MVGLKPIVQIADQVLATPVTIDAGRCVAMRHRASSCRSCMEACEAEAIRLEAGRIVLDKLACDGCMACLPACPTEAISVAKQNDQGISTIADAALEHAGGVMVFACERAMDRSDLDVSGVVAVPCLASLDESLLCEQASRGAYRIVLVDAGCAACPRAACSPSIDKTVESANALLDMCEAGVSVERLDAFPAEVIRDADPGYDASRRHALSHAGRLVGEQILKSVDSEQGGDAALAPNPLSTFAIDKRMRLLNALDAMDAPTDGMVGVRGFHTLQVAADRCTGCGVCAMFCPTGSLRFGEIAEGVLEWSAAECSGCSLCQDVCAQSAISIEPGVRCAELFELEPRTLHHGSAAPAVQAQATAPWRSSSRGSLAKRFYAGTRAVDPAIERVRSKVTISM